MVGILAKQLRRLRDNHIIVKLVEAVVEVESQNVEIQQTSLYLVVPSTTPSTSSTIPVRNIITMCFKLKMEGQEGTEWRRGWNLICLITFMQPYFHLRKRRQHFDIFHFKVPSQPPPLEPIWAQGGGTYPSLLNLRTKLFIRVPPATLLEHISLQNCLNSHFALFTKQL